MFSRAQTSLLIPSDGFEPVDGAPRGLTLAAKTQCLCKPALDSTPKPPQSVWVIVEVVLKNYFSVCVTALPIPGNTIQTVQQLYSGFARLFRAPGHPSNVSSANTYKAGSRPSALCPRMLPVVCLPIWSFHDTDLRIKVTCVQLALDFVSRGRIPAGAGCLPRFLLAYWPHVFGLSF